MKWVLKIAAKIVLSRLPVGYRSFHRLGLFRHGAMQESDYAIRVVRRHVEQLGGESHVRGAVCLELGPGDSLASAVIANALGARKIYLVDAGEFANKDMTIYRRLAQSLRERGYDACDLDGVDNVDEMLKALNTQYLIEGCASLRSIPDASVDMIWSQAVLEHVRLGELDETFLELRRISAPDSRMSHRIDFKDHLGGSLNNLRFSERIWESDFMASSGFYTNRARSSRMQQALRDAGFDLISVSAGKWETLPLPRRKMARAFRDLDEDDLLTNSLDVLTAPTTAPSRG